MAIYTAVMKCYLSVIPIEVFILESLLALLDLIREQER
jgi:hypothetical protein